MQGDIFPMPVDPSQFSLDNTVLTVNITDSINTIVFQCIMDLVRCNGTIIPCPERRYRGPLHEVQVFGKRCDYKQDSFTGIFF